VQRTRKAAAEQEGSLRSTQRFASDISQQVRTQPVARRVPSVQSRVRCLLPEICRVLPPQSYYDLDVTQNSVLVCPQLLSAETAADTWDGQRQRRLVVAQGVVQTAAEELRSHLGCAEQVSVRDHTLAEGSGKPSWRHMYVTESLS